MMMTLCGAAQAAAAPAASVKVSLDSAVLLMGNVTPLHIEVIEEANAGGDVFVPADTMCANVEIHSLLRSDTTDLGNNRRQINIDLLIQSFDSGVYRLNPVRYIAGNETIVSNQPVLKVNPCLVDSLETIHDFADVSDVDRHFADYLPDVVVKYWVWILVVLLLAAGGWFAWMRYKKRAVAEPEKAKPVLPPYEEAIEALSALRGENLCQKGMEKEFYTRLTDILRHYLDRRFGINAMEMTSTQILDALHANPDTKLSQPKMQQVLAMADFVKFAKVRPLPADNTAAFNSAEAFVEDTRPVAQPEPTDETAPQDETTRPAETSTPTSNTPKQ